MVPADVQGVQPHAARRCGWNTSVLGLSRRADAEGCIFAFRALPRRPPAACYEPPEFLPSAAGVRQRMLSTGEQLHGHGPGRFAPVPKASRYEVSGLGVHMVASLLLRQNIIAHSVLFRYFSIWPSEGRMRFL